MNNKDIINKQFGNLKVTKYLGSFPYGKSRQSKYECICSCGTICQRWRNQLISKVTTSCGIKKNHKIDKPKIDQSGKRFGRLTVLEFSHFDRTKGVKQYWKCKCDCGTEKIIGYNSLHNGDTKSCGCLHKENIEYFKTNECIQKRSLPKNQAVINELYSRYKISAVKRKVEFDISKEDFTILLFQNCYYCGCKPNKEAMKNKKFNGNPLINGVDRRNNTIGYNKENCVSCCKICNYAKRDLSEQEFEDWINMLIKYRENK